MATFSSVTRQHVLQAIEEYDRRGGHDFLAVYGFVPSVEWTLQHDGREYDLPAVVGVAHRYATGRLATSDDLSGSLPGAASILRKRGFEVGEPAPTTRTVTRTRSSAPRARRTTAAVPRRAAEPERVAPVCPTCSMTLPGTGHCDYCS